MSTTTKIPSKTYKSRVRMRTFFDGRFITAKYVVEFCIDRKWMPLGDEENVTKFDTKEAAEKAREEGVAKLAR